MCNLEYLEESSEHRHLSQRADETVLSDRSRTRRVAPVDRREHVLLLIADVTRRSDVSDARLAVALALLELGVGERVEARVVDETATARVVLQRNRTASGIARHSCAFHVTLSIS